jgi:phosphoribosylformylglycinamidine cyclo-ligase
MVSGTDGVGTKLRVAQMMDIHDTVGIDLVAMCVNDILVHGAEPLFFLDYIAVGQLIPEHIEALVKGVSTGCLQAGCSLIGGETAELPGMYAAGDYDLAGFAVGVVEKNEILDGKKVCEGDVVLGVGSSGLHSNGYSLARKVLLDSAALNPDIFVEELGHTVGEELLTPTHIYVKSIRELLTKVPVHALAHITGGGIPGNLSRVIPDGLEAQIKRGSWQAPPIFEMIARLGDVEPEEMERTFNMGLGFMAVCPPENADEAIRVLRTVGETVAVVGEIARGDQRVRMK